MTSSEYIIRSTLNESSTTTVHTAFHPALNRTVLLKILHKHLSADKEFVDRFVREARACALLRSEHIVQVYDLTEYDGAPAIVMEYVDGPSLKTIIEEQGPRPFDFVRRTAIHILRALHVAHGQGIIHRDVKPGNILLTPSGILKITDFGLATIPQSPTITSDGAILGTPAYMSPEQIHAERLDAQTDLFSLGVTLIETITGKRLFDGESYAECIKKIMLFKGDISLSENTDIPPEFRQFLERLVAPDLNKRYSSAEEALSALGDQQPVQLTARERSNASGLRGRRGMIAAAFLTLVIACLIFFFVSHRAGNSIVSVPRTDSSTAVRQPLTPPISSSLRKEKDSAEMEKTPEKENRVHLQMPAQTTSIDADSGFIRVVSTPWAKVYLNNQYVGVTPIARPLKVKAGPCVVTFNNPSFSPIVKNVTVLGSEDLLVEADFMASSGFLLVQAIPWAEIYVDDQYRETTPLKPMLISIGNHKVHFHNPVFHDIVREVTVLVHDTARLSISFPRENSK